MSILPNQMFDGEQLTELISRLAVLSISRNGVDASTCVLSDVVTGPVLDTVVTWPTILVLTSALVTTAAQRANWRQSYTLCKTCACGTNFKDILYLNRALKTCRIFAVIENKVQCLVLS